MEYKIPDPKEEPLKFLVLIYKTTKGVPYDDRSWDAVHWGRTAKAAKALLDICGTGRAAQNCITELSEKFEEAQLGWTLETIVKHAHDWISKKRGIDGNAHRARFLKDFNDRRRIEPDNPLRQEVRSVLDSLGSLKDPEKGNQKDDSPA